jgi:CHAT domain-containing protein
MARKRFRLFNQLQSLSKKAFLQACLAFLVVFLGTGVTKTRANALAVISQASLQKSVKEEFVNSQSRVNSTVPRTLATSRLALEGRELYAAGRFSQAVQVWQQVAQAYQKQRDVLSQAMALSNLSLAYQQLGQWNRALDASAESLNLLGYPEQKRAGNAGEAGGEIQNLEVLAQALNTQGSLQLALGQAEQAIATWQQATATYTKAGDRAGITGSLINQAQALQVLGLYRRALMTLGQVNQQLQDQPASALKVSGLRSLGNALQVAGALNQSQQVLHKGLALAQQLQLSPDISDILLSLGNVVRAQQDTKAALNFYQQAAASTDPRIRTKAQLNQLSLLLETGQLSDANELLPQIQSQIAKLPPSRAAVYVRINFAQSLMQPKRTATAAPPTQTHIAQLLATAVQQAKSIKDQRAEAYALGYLGKLYEQNQQLGNAQDLTQQALMLAQGINAPDIGYRFQAQLGRILKAQGNVQAAIAAYSEATNMLKSIRSDLVATNPDIQFDFRDEVEPIYRQLVELLLQPQKPSQQNLVQARDMIESLQLAELNNFFRTACLEGLPIQIDQAIDKEDISAAAVYPIILTNRLDVIVKLPGQPLRHYTTPIAQKEVERLLEELRQKLTEPHTLREVQTLSEQVYNWLIRPVETELAKSHVRTLVFVLDGSLRNIPMAALYNGQQYLVQKYAVALTPGLQLLPPKPINQIELKALTAGLTESRQGFSALNNVAGELNQIKSEMPSTILLNQEFTSTTLQKEIDSVPFPVVHLATHGQFSSLAEKTFILAWDKPIHVNELSSLLQTRDTSSIHNPLELLVLSACQTATGDNRATLGLAGMAVRAGARSTLASLWNVSDRSTALLMSRFYQELGNRSVTKAEALRQAQLSLLNNPKYKRPMLWSPYVLVGNWL